MSEIRRYRPIPRRELFRIIALIPFVPYNDNSQARRDELKHDPKIALLTGMIFGFLSGVAAGQRLDSNEVKKTLRIDRLYLPIIGAVVGALMGIMSDEMISR